MKSFEIAAEQRNKIGKTETKKLRTAGKVPCVLYGGKENIHFSVNEVMFSKVIYTNEVFLIILDFGKTQKQAIVQSFQFHPVTDKVIHADLIEIVEGKPVSVSIPVKLTGNSVGVLDGGKLKHASRYLKVRGKINDIPESLEIDITKLKIGDSVMVRDLSFPNMELLDLPSTLVVFVSSSRAAAIFDEAEASLAESAAGVAEGEAGEGEKTEEGKEGQAETEEASKEEAETSK